MNAKLELPELFVSLPHDCSYLKDRIATSLFVDPEAIISVQHYDLMTQLGFRRSGNLVYRPHCESCRECLAVRVPVATFRPNRSQRRIWKRNQELVVNPLPASFNEEHFSLYRKYQQIRHSNSSMDTGDPGQYENFLFGTLINTEVLEFRFGPGSGRDNALLAIAVIDKLEQGLSAVYTYFDPSESRRAPGVYAVLYEIELARKLGLPYVYLGYYIADSRKMNYKINYQPLEAFTGKNWNEICR